MLFIMNHGHLTFNKGILFWGITYGVVQVLFLIFKTLAMSNGPVSITTLIGNCSMLLSISASVLIWKETLHIGHIVGIALLLFSILLCTKTDQTTHFSKHWPIYCLLFFILCGSVGIIFKLFAASENHANRLDMMLISTITMILFLSTASFFHKDKLPSMNIDGKRNGTYNNYELEFPCIMTTTDYELGEFIHTLRNSIRAERRLVFIDHKILMCNINWIRDHIHTMKAFCHWEYNIDSFLSRCSLYSDGRRNAL